MKILHLLFPMERSFIHVNYAIGVEVFPKIIIEKRHLQASGVGGKAILREARLPQRLNRRPRHDNVKRMTRHKLAQPSWARPVAFPYCDAIPGIQPMGDQVFQFFSLDAEASIGVLSDVLE